MKKKLELLAPAGSFPTLIAAVKAGADAVYFGLKEFSMRAGAVNFEIKDLSKIREICNSTPRKTKMYATLNTIIYNSEISKIEKTISKLKGKVDAIICWDLAVVNLCRKYKIPFFISTQASVANKEAALAYKKLGAKRIILARELTLDQIKEISKVIDVEVFIHGAMCVAVSGRCFMSQFLFDKSANRGACLQPCRRSYIVKDKQEGYELELENDKVMSPKDLCTLPFFEKIKSCGAISFKIEGRNRDARYVETVVRIYRKALDKKLTKLEIDKAIEELKSVYNRGFSDGFFFGVPTADDFSNVDNSAATKKKEFVGKIYHYLPKLSVALVKVSGEFSIGDDIVVIGKNTGIVYDKIERLEVNKKSVGSVKKGDEVGLKISGVRKGDEIYKVVDN